MVHPENFDASKVWFDKINALLSKKIGGFLEDRHWIENQWKIPVYLITILKTLVWISNLKFKFLLDSTICTLIESTFFLDYARISHQFVLQVHFDQNCKKSYKNLCHPFFFGLWDLIMKMNYSGKKIIQQNRKCPGPKQPRFCLFTRKIDT